MTKGKKKDNINHGRGLRPPTFRIEADGGAGYMNVLVCGVVGISEFSDEEIKLLTRRECVKICGKCLEVSIFEGNSVEISGEVESIFRGKTDKGKRGIR